MKITAIILAGGNSTRMGEDKGLMALDGKPMIQHVIDVAKGVVDDIIIVANNEDYSRFSYPVFKDEVKGKGPLGGLYTGLLHSDTQMNLVLSCDVPYINASLLNLVISHAKGFDVTIPQKDEQTHQLIGVFSKNCLMTFKNAIDDDRLKLTTTFKELNLKIVDATHFSQRLFVNLNSKDDIKG